MKKSMYEQLKKDAEASIKEEKETHIYEQIKSRVKRKEELSNELKVIDKELIKLVKDGKLENLEDYVKINSGVKTAVLAIDINN